MSISNNTVNKVTTATPSNDFNIHDARMLIGDHASAKILLNENVYVLKITKQNKLILTK
jgi:hemin uptake protein HemP